MENAVPPNQPADESTPSLRPPEPVTTLPSAAKLSRSPVISPRRAAVLCLIGVGIFCLSLALPWGSYIPITHGAPTPPQITAAPGWEYFQAAWYAGSTCFFLPLYLGVAVIAALFTLYQAVRVLLNSGRLKAGVLRSVILYLTLPLSFVLLQSAVSLNNQASIDYGYGVAVIGMVIGLLGYTLLIRRGDFDIE